MEFEYDHQIVAQAMVNIDDIGDFGLEAYNDEGYYYYLFVKTVLGETYIATCNSVLPDTTIISDKFSIEITHFNYNNRKISKAIYNFLNDFRKGITGVTVMGSEEVISYFKDSSKMLTDIMEGRA